MHLSKKDKKFFPLERLIYNYRYHPNRIAVSSNKINFTYKEFYEYAFSFSKLIKKNSKIAILDDEKIYAYIAMFGSLMANCTYIPITSEQPKKRISEIIRISKVKYIFSNKKLDFLKVKNNKIKMINFKNIKILKKIRLINNKISKKIAYIIFTSGSSGHPKGVKISQLNLDHYIRWILNYMRLPYNKNCAQYAPLGFDLSVADTFLSICSGSTLFPVNNKYDKVFFGNFLKEKKINILTCVPSTIDALKNSNTLNSENLKNLEHIFFCGETLLKSQVKLLFKTNPKLIITNAYGPTETTVSCTYLRLTKKNYKKFTKSETSIGKPINGMKLHLVSNKKITKQRGEIYIQGPQVGHGYLNFKSKKKFIKGKNIYKTGDYAKFLYGNLYFDGRKDNQIKINGYRVEIEEIEKNCKKIFLIDNCVCIYKKKKIFMFLKINKKISINTIKLKLGKLLPLYMIPSDIIFIKKFPLNFNGKIDRKKLYNSI